MNEDPEQPERLQRVRTTVEAMRLELEATRSELRRRYGSRQEWIDLSPEARSLANGLLSGESFPASDHD